MLAGNDIHATKKAFSLLALYTYNIFCTFFPWVPSLSLVSALLSLSSQSLPAAAFAWFDALKVNEWVTDGRTVEESGLLLAWLANLFLLEAVAVVVKGKERIDWEKRKKLPTCWKRKAAGITQRKVLSFLLGSRFGPLAFCSLSGWRIGEKPCQS